MPSAAAFFSIASASAMSDRDNPRCQKRMRSDVALAPRPGADDDVGELGMDVVLGEKAGIDMRTQRPEAAGAELPDIVDDELVDHIGNGKLERTHRSIRHKKTAGSHPGGLE